MSQVDETMDRKTIGQTTFGGLRFRKLPPKAQTVVFPMILSLLMSGVVSAVATLNAVGLVDGILLKILHAWEFSYVIAFPAAFLLVPVVRRIVAVVVEIPSPRG